jgi:hypothetical protein
VVIKKSSVKNRQSSSGVLSDLLVERWEDGFEGAGVECSPAGNGLTTEAEESPSI